MRACLAAAFGLTLIFGANPATAQTAPDDYRTTIRAHVWKWDANKDGKLNLEEWTSYRNTTQSKHSPERAFQMVDANGDGKLDGAEIDGYIDRLYARKMPADRF